MAADVIWRCILAGSFVKAHMRFWILGIDVARSLEIDAEEGKYGQIYPHPSRR